MDRDQLFGRSQRENRKLPESYHCATPCYSSEVEPGTMRSELPNLELVGAQISRKPVSRM